MTKMRLTSSLFQIPIINNVLFYDTIDSTNNKAKELAKRGSVHGTLIVAREQTAGRGRMGRSFSSDRQGLYFSLILRPNIAMEQLSGITLMVALAVSSALDTLCNISTRIKWPNDIYLNEKKLVGILTESGSDYVVIGIGVNVNTKEFPEDIKSTATSLLLETGTEYNPEDILSAILKKLDRLYSSFAKSNSLDFSYTTECRNTTSFIAEYNHRLASLNRHVYIIPYDVTKQTDNPALINTAGLSPMLCKGIDSKGNLICQDITGLIHRVNSGEISLRQL